jgi:hypothetical protein
VVAGALNGDIKTSAFGAACVQGGGSATGAMLVLGGTTTITLSGNAGTLEVCGLAVNQPALGRSVELPVFGLKADVVTTDTDTLTPAADPTGTTWVNPAKARTVDATVATYSLAKNKTSNPLVFTAVSGTKVIPSTVTTLTADVTALASAAATFTVTVLNKDGTTACTTPTAGTMPTAALAKVSLNVTCTKALVAPLSVQFKAITPNSGSTRTISVDGLVLRYSVQGPKMSAASGCVIAPGGCDVISSSGNKNQLWLDGEVYLPLGKVTLQVPNTAAAVSTLGVVVRVLSVKTTGSTAAVPIVATENGALNPGDVTVTAKVGDAVSMACRVTFTVTGATISASTVQSCTVAR